MAGNLSHGPPVAGLRRGRLALVVGAELWGAVGPLGRGVEGHERQLRYGQARVELDRDAGEIGDLQAQRPADTRVHEACGAVDAEPEAHKRALTLDTGPDVARDLDVLLGAPE